MPAPSQGSGLARFPQTRRAHRRELGDAGRRQGCRARRVRCARRWQRVSFAVSALRAGFRCFASRSRCGECRRAGVWQGRRRVATSHQRAPTARGVCCRDRRKPAARRALPAFGKERESVATPPANALGQPTAKARRRRHAPTSAHHGATLDNKELGEKELGEKELGEEELTTCCAFFMVMLC